MPPRLVGLAHDVFRCHRGTDAFTLPPWDRVLQSKRGRWDDTKDEYRVLYGSSTKVGAFVEVLQDLRHDAATMALLHDVEGDDDRPEPTILSIVADQLRNRRLSVLVTIRPEQRIVDIASGATRSHVERTLGMAVTKIGDYTGGDVTLSRRTSRLFFDENERGLVAPSAEHHTSNTLAIFERHSTSGKLRIDMLATETHLALTQSAEVASAVGYLFGENARAR